MRDRRPWWFPWFDAPPTVEDIRYVYSPDGVPEKPPKAEPMVKPTGTLTLPLVERETGGRWSRRSLTEECDGDEAKADQAFELLYTQPVPLWQQRGGDRAKVTS